MIIGVSGIGKTTLASFFPNTYWVLDPLESGIYDLVESGGAKVQPEYIHEPFDNFNQLLAFNEQVLKDPKTLPPNVSTIVYESMGGFEKFAQELCCQLSFGNDWGDKQGGFMFYQKGYEITASQYWVKLVKQLSRLRELGYNIVMTGHSDVKTMKNAIGDDYVCETSNCRPELWKVTHAAFENVFFYSMDVRAVKDNKFARARAASFTRTLHVTKTPYHDAKNRCNMQEDIVVEGTPYASYLALCKAARWDHLTLHY